MHGFVMEKLRTTGIAQLGYTDSYGKATSNRYTVSRPLLKYIFMRAGGPFPLFHYYF